MKWSKFFILAAALAALITVTSCGGKKAVEEEILSVRIAEQVPNLISPGVWDGQAFTFNGSIYDYLVEIDEKGELSPALALSWDSDDGRIWNVQLREGVTFHDGSSFDSEDVKFTLERTQDERIGHLKAQDFSVVESVETDGKHRVIINLKEARPTFMYQLTDYNMAVLSSDYDYIAKGETAPMGTGAFMLKTLAPKESAHLVKNPDFWDEGLPYVDELLIYFVPDIDSSVAMLEAGQVDIVPQVTPLIKQRLESLGGFQVVSPYQEQRFISMAVDRPPFDNPKIILAMKYAMDPEILAKACQGTLGETIFYDETPIMTSLGQHVDLPLRGRDLDKAKELLAEAGYADGVSFELYYASDHPYSPALAQTLKELAEPAGFSVELKGTPRDIYLSQHWLNAPMSITGWGGRVDPSVLLMLSFHSEGPWNESHVADPKLDAIIEEIAGEVDPIVRQSKYKELQEYSYDAGTVINVQVPYLVALSGSVRDYRQPITMIPQLKYLSIEE